MTWLDRIRKLDARLDEESRARSADEPDMNWRRYFLVLITMCVGCGGVFVFISDIWITFFIPSVYCMVVVFMYRQHLPSFKEL